MAHPEQVLHVSAKKLKDFPLVVEEVRDPKLDAVVTLCRSRITETEVTWTQAARCHEAMMNKPSARSGCRGWGCLGDEPDFATERSDKLTDASQRTSERRYFENIVVMPAKERGPLLIEARGDQHAPKVDADAG